MADRHHRNRALAPPGDRAAATPDIGLTADDAALEDDPVLPPLDINGFDPGEFEWRPVPRRPRADGWTPDIQRSFIQALADTGLVDHAARAVGMSVQSAYRLRRAPGGDSFSRAWDAALAAAAGRVLDLAFKRAIEGEETPVFDRDGCRVGARWRTNDRLTMFILRAYMPDRFRHANRDVRAAGEAPPPPVVPVAEAIAALSPAPPADPHRLIAPDRLGDMVHDARALAAYYARCPADIDREPYVAPVIAPDHPAATLRALTRRAKERPPELYHGEEEE